MKKRFSLIKITKAESEYCKELYSPKFESDLEISRKFKPGQEIIGSANNKDIRNYRFLKKYFALMKLAYHNMPEQLSDSIKSIDELRKMITMQAGYRTEHTSLSGGKFWTADSIAFDSMTEESFTDLYNKSVDIICQYILIGVDSEEINSQILNFM